MDHHVKSTQTDMRSAKRFRFASSRQRSQRASADVYRSYKRRIGITTSAASREERVHHSRREESRATKRSRIAAHDTNISATGGNRKSVLISPSKKKEKDKNKKDTQDVDSINLQGGVVSNSVNILDNLDLDVTEASFSEELDLANDRNASEIFRHLYRIIWPLARSLPEVLHHASKIVQLLLAYLLSNASEPHAKSSTETMATSVESLHDARRERFILNHATTDILHLLAVLAKDLRHEIQPYLHQQIIPRIVVDLLNQPTTAASPLPNNVDAVTGRAHTEQHQFMQVDVSVLEAAFRSLSYIFRYAAEALIAEVDDKLGTKRKHINNVKRNYPCLDKLRQYYGATLAHRRDVVRRLAAETFAPLVRKLKHESSRRRHLRRVLKAYLATTDLYSACVVDNDRIHKTTMTRMPAGAIKLHANAVDGIAHFFFEVARGASGQIHSKGLVAVKVVIDVLCSDSEKGSTPAGRELIYSVTSIFLAKLFRHLHRSFFREIMEKIISATQTVLKPVQEGIINDDSDGVTTALSFESFDFTRQELMMRLLNQLVLFNRGYLLEHCVDDQTYSSRGELISIVVRVLDTFVPLFERLSRSVQATTLALLSSTWKAVPVEPKFTKAVRMHIDTIVQCHPQANSRANPLHPAHVLAQDLVTCLPPAVGMGVVATSILSSAARLAGDGDIDMCLSLVLSVARGLLDSEDLDESDPEGALFSLDGAIHCRITSHAKHKLLETCLLSVDGSKDKDTWDSRAIGRLGVALRCVAFVALAGVNRNEDEERSTAKTSLTKASTWLLRIFTLAADSVIQGDDKSQENAILASLALESLARLSTKMSELNVGGPFIKEVFSQTMGSLQKCLIAQPTSHWMLKAGSAAAQTLGMFELVLDRRDDLFNALVPNLRSPSHCRRLYSLQILQSLPKQPFVTDYASLDLTGDLDEETNEFQAYESSAAGAGRPSLCDIIDTLTSIESTLVEIQNERELLSSISRVEMLGKTSKLPALYTEAAANHMLGILFIKFSPVWKGAVRAFSSLADQEAPVWPPLREQITTLMNRFPARELQASLSTTSSKGCPLVDFSYHYSLSVAWGGSNGADTSELGKRVSRHLPTDEATVLKHLWSIVEGAPQLLTAHSRDIVPIFLQFMHSQFYSFYLHDPDACELRIEDHIEHARRFDRTLLQGHMLQQRLISILKVFAGVKGPQQLYKHKVLLSIFKSLLSHDGSISKLAFTCVGTYEISPLSSFSGLLESLFEKGGLKDALLKFTTALESSTIDKENRHNLIPVVMRILFGRLSARVGGRKSSKDPPAARRAAVLSFIAVLCEDENELYTFSYLMIRNFVPDRSMLRSIEDQDGAMKYALLESVKKITVDHAALLPTQVHIGFLYLLEQVVSHLGHRVTSFVDQFISIILALCKVAEVKDALSESDEENDNAAAEATGANALSQQGLGSIRTLCFRRLSDIFSQYSEVVDFSTYGRSLWHCMKRSVEMLPETCLERGKAPALLSLLLTLSSHPRLVPLLSVYSGAIPCAIKCLADMNSQSVVDVTLSFIDNLLVYDENHSRSAVESLILRHVDLILQQFMLRLDLKPTGSSSEEPSRIPARKRLRSATWRRELRILCGITGMLELAEGSSKIPGKNEVLVEKLCALLMPYLEGGNGVTETDQSNVVQIMGVLIPNVRADSGVIFFEQLAQLLGPVKAKPASLPMPIRQGIAFIISKTPHTSNERASKVSRVIQDLCRPHPKRIDEMDYDVVIPALNSLVHTESDACWLSLARTEKSGFDTTLIAPLIYTCFHYLFSNDGVLSRGAFKSLKTLIGVAARQAALAPKDDVAKENSLSASGDNQWEWLLVKVLVPAVRGGLATRNTAARRFYVLLIAEVGRACKSSKKPNLYGDLSVLVRDDDPDLDFFLNITHVQMHRRTRAFQRLRKLLALNTDEVSVHSFSLQSLSNVLLPISTHPIYEAKIKGEEALAVEAIATVGAISRHLSWNKYNNILWTTLIQFHRHAEQERYLVALICSIVDGFHFDVSATELEGNDDTESPSCGSAVWRALERRFIPKLESLLTKETVDSNGTKFKTLRVSLVLALVNFFKKISQTTLESRLPGLLTVICDGLKNRDSDARDAARITLAKVVTEIDMLYLADVLKAIAIALTDGFRLHVRIATVHSILLAIAEKYSPPLESSDEEAMNLPFDQSVPALMDIIQQDLFGAAQERRDAEGVDGRYVKEAAGSKSHNSIELVSSLIVFKPSLAKSRGVATSSIHSVVSPLVERLKSPYIELKTVRRIKECLFRVVTGLARNPTTSVKEVLPFVYATVVPFIGEIDSIAKTNPDGGLSDEEEPLKAIQVSGKTTEQISNRKPVTSNKGNVISWNPSSLNASKTSKGAANARQKEAIVLLTVQDGASAPRLTGSSRYATAFIASTSRINEPSYIGAIVFSLRLLHSTLKKRRLEANDPALAAMVDPFAPLLTCCVCSCRETDVALLALRCLSIFLSFRAPSYTVCAAQLGSKTLELLSSSGLGATQNIELCQACFKMLVVLISLDDSRGNSGDHVRGEEALSRYTATPLDPEQMKIMISILQESILDTVSYNAALSCIKAIMSRCFTSPEFYDLMETILELSVRGQTASLRQQCSGIVINYLLNYPLGGGRLEQHLKQIAVNVKYEYEEGRLSGVILATSVVEKVPVPVLEKNIELFFLPLTLQLVNDDSKQCREAVANCLSRMLRRLPTDLVQRLYDFAYRWSQGKVETRRASVQLFVIFVDSRETFMKRGETASQLVWRLSSILANQSKDDADWETLYFSLICLEKLAKLFPQFLAGRHKLWSLIAECLAHCHPFVKIVSLRLIKQHLESLDVALFAEDGSNTFLVKKCGSLYEIARNICFQLNSEEDHQSDEVTALCIASLSWLLPAMDSHPLLCYATNEQNDGNDESMDKKTTPVAWVMKRLSSMAKPRGPKRRQAVFKAFGAFANKCPALMVPHLELVLESLHRIDVETDYNLEKPAQASSQLQKCRNDGPSALAENSIPAEAALARNVMRLLEEQCDPHERFLEAYAAVKSRARDKKEQRKLEVNSEAVRDPKAAAKRRQQEYERGKNRKKIRVEDSRHKRISKRQYY